jgi:hypothetical protein
MPMPMPMPRWTEAALTKAILYAAALLLCTVPVAARRLPPGADVASPESILAIGLGRHGLEHFSGSLMGVKADVQLDRRNRRAHIQLRGVVFAGGVSGIARFASNSASSAIASENVVIQEPLKSALARRFVSIDEARHDPSRDEVVVTAKLPMGLGKHSIVLRRADAC